MFVCYLEKELVEQLGGEENLDVSSPLVVTSTMETSPTKVPTARETSSSMSLESGGSNVVVSVCLFFVVMPL